MSKTSEKKSNCDYCVNYSYNDETECYECDMDLDEDEMYRFINGKFRSCPYFHFGDEYKIVQKQN